MEEKGLKFFQAVLENFKNIKACTIAIDGKNLAVIGGNDEGKSSLIQSLKGAASSKFLPEMPIMQGEERAETAVLVKGYDAGGQYVEYHFAFYFSPSNKTGRIVMTDKDGNVQKNMSRKDVDAIFGDISFSITDFLNKSGAKQAQDVKDLTGRAEDLDAIDAKVKALMEDKLHHEKNNKDKESVLKQHGYDQQQLELYSKPVPLPPIEKKLADAGPALELHERAQISLAAHDGFMKDVERLRKEGAEENMKNKNKIQALKEEIRLLDERCSELQNREVANDKKKQDYEQKIFEVNEWIKKNPKPDTESVSKELSDAKLHNSHYDIIQKHVTQQKELYAGKEKVATMVQEIEKLRKEKVDIIASSKLPVEGLSYDENGLYLNGLPFNKEQINTATRLAVGEEIQMAKHQNLRCIFIEEGSLYDRESMIKLVKKAEARGYQVIAEFVNFSGGPLEVKWLEDYLNIKQ